MTYRPPTESEAARTGGPEVGFRAEDIAASKAFRAEYVGRPNVVTAEEMPFELSPDGLIKHLVHHRLNTRECCVEAYMLFLEAEERSGKHRHMWEEIAFVVEGSGHDLHWDMRFDCQEEFDWQWAEEPKRFEWKRGDFVYIPPFTIHQHVAGEDGPARLIVMSNRIIKEMGFDWYDQIETAARTAAAAAEQGR
jgi:quercetin dioxygenase-like cupin family protein